MAEPGAGTATKAPLSKEELRRLMKERSSKKIDSPFAKYDGAGQLFCLLCKFHVKNEASWTAHVSGRQHQQTIALAQASTKTKSDSRNIPAIKTVGKTAEVSTTTVPYRKTEKRVNEVSVDSSLKKLKVSDSGQDKVQTRTEGQIPADFFDVSEPVTAISLATDPTPANKLEHNSPASLLPDNFFDKPTKNIKQRQEKEKKAQNEEEWSKFQKVIHEETHKAAVIVEHDDEETVRQRELEEIEEQMLRWEKIHDLELKKEEVAKKALADIEMADGIREGSDLIHNSQEKDKIDSDSDDSEDFNSMDWRKRKLW